MSRDHLYPCPNCGELGAHYAPPSFGESGFYICESKMPQQYTPWTPRLIPCSHFWLEVRTRGETVTAVCKHRGCQKREDFSMTQWAELAVAGQCMNKPVRT